MTKQPGDSVIGGTVNGLGTFDMIVTRAGKDTALAQIVRLVEEAQNVTKQPGDSVIGGTVNGLGTFDMIVTRAGKDTALAQIVRLVEEAQT